MAFPVTVLSPQEVYNMAPVFRNIIADHEPELIVCGLPLSLDGQENAQALRVRECAAKVHSATGLPIEFVDERLSSSQAKRVLREAGLDERHQRGKVDGIAASLFLQTYLDGNVDSEERA